MRVMEWQWQTRGAAAMQSTRTRMLRQLHCTMARITRGELGMRVMKWLQQARGAASVHTSRCKAHRQLCRTMMRVMRGDLGARVMDWRQQARDAAVEKQVQLTKSELVAVQSAHATKEADLEHEAQHCAGSSAC